MINIILVHAIMMGLLVYELTTREENLLLEVTRKQAENIATGIASSAVHGVLNNDLAGLNELLNSYKQHQDLTYLMIHRADGRVLAHNHTPYIGQYLKDETSLSLLKHAPAVIQLKGSSDQLNIAAPILSVSQTQAIGWVRVSVNLTQLQQDQQHIMYRGILYIVLATLFGGIMAWLLARKTTASLASIQHASQQFVQGQIHIRAPKQPYTELQSLADGMNALLDAIRQREQELTQTKEDMTFLAMHDPLTLLPNRRAFCDYFHSLLQPLTPYSKFSLVMLDLDGFKPVNDEYGHDIGDELLKLVAHRLTHFITSQAGAMAARLGGDEFALILTVNDQLEAQLQTLLKQLSAPYSIHGKTIRNISASIGAVRHPRHPLADHDSLLKVADNAMYEVKRTGRNRVYVIPE